MGRFLAGPWEFNLFVAANLALIMAAYTIGVRRHPRWPVRRTVAFFAGMLMLTLAYLGPVAGWSHTFFWAHMTQHLVVMMAAAPLIVYSSPILLLSDCLTDEARERWLDPVLNSSVVRWLTNPIVSWLAFACVLLGTHFTPFYDWALRNHDAELFIERPLFLLAALLYYLPLIGNNPLPNRPAPAVKLVSLATMMLPEALVGGVIYFAPVLLYPTFGAPRPFGLDPLADQQLSGAIMWALVMTIDSFWMMVVAAEWFADEEKRSEQIDAEIAAEAVGS